MCWKFPDGNFLAFNHRLNNEPQSIFIFLVHKPSFNFFDSFLKVDTSFVHASNKTCSVISALKYGLFIIVFAVSVLENKSDVFMENFSIDIEVTRDDVYETF